MTNEELRYRFGDYSFTDMVDMIRDAEKALDHIREQFLIDSMSRPTGITGQAIRKSYEMYPYVNGKFIGNGE